MTRSVGPANSRELRLGLVDGIVIAIAERVRARAIVTLDLRHFGAAASGRPKLLLRRVTRTPRASPPRHGNIRGSK
jgi:hypothetical protein